MDLRKYEEAISQLSEYLISNYFNDNEVAYYKAKSKLLKLISNKTKTKQINNLPFFLPFLKNNFVILCQLYPDFIGFILFKYNKPNILKRLLYWFWIYYKFISLVSLRWKKNKFGEKYQNIHIKIESLIKNKSIVREEIDEIINLIEPISHLSFPRTVQTSISHIYNELRFSLQLLHSTNDLNKMNYYDCHIFDGYYLIKFDIEFATTAKYLKYPLIASMLSDLGIIYKYIEIVILDDISKEQIQSKIPQDTDILHSEINIKMIPYPGSGANNVIKINDKEIKGIRNVPFELLYYLLWLRKEYPNDSYGLEMGGEIDDDHILEMIKNDDKILRFGAAWNNSTNTRTRNAKSSAVNAINSIIKSNYDESFDLVIENFDYYTLSSTILSENIQLDSFQKNR